MVRGYNFVISGPEKHCMTIQKTLADKYECNFPTRASFRGNADMMLSRKKLRPKGFALSDKDVQTLKNAMPFIEAERQRRKTLARQDACQLAQTDQPREEDQPIHELGQQHSTAGALPPAAENVYKSTEQVRAKILQAVHLNLS